MPARPPAIRTGTRQRGPDPRDPSGAARRRYEVWLTDAEHARIEAIHGAVTAGLIRSLALAAILLRDPR